MLLDYVKRIAFVPYAVAVVVDFFHPIRFLNAGLLGDPGQV